MVCSRFCWHPSTRMAQKRCRWSTYPAPAHSGVGGLSIPTEQRAAPGLCGMVVRSKHSWGAAPHRRLLLSIPRGTEHQREQPGQSTGEDRVHAGAAPSMSSHQPSLSGTHPIARARRTADALFSFACDADVGESRGGAICVAAQHQEGAPSLCRTSKKQRRSSPPCCELPWVQHSDPARTAPARAAPAQLTVLLCCTASTTTK